MTFFRQLLPARDGWSLILLTFISCQLFAADKPHLLQEYLNDVSIIVPIPLTISIDQNKARLGKLLFEDKRISKDGKKACVECHLSHKGGTDNEPLSIAINGKQRSTNTPTIFNVGLLPMLGWTGTGTSLESVTEAIIKSKQGLATDWPELINKLNAMPAYRNAFESIYNQAIEPDHVKEVMAEYMRSLITPNSSFDKYLRGQEDAISADELKGYQLFKSYGCASCHQGISLGGNMTSPFGVFGNYMQDTGKESKADLGLYNKTTRPEDKYIFRVPGLRNVGLTAPYFHDGSAATLDKAIDVMGRYMLSRDIPEKDIRLIKQFLETLTGELHGEPL